MTRWIMTAAGLGLAALCSPAVAQEAAPAASLPQDEVIAERGVEDIALARDRYERITVPVSIAGKGPWRFFIDTGAQATVVTRRITDALHIAPTGRAELVAMGSSKQVDTVELDDLTFANRSISGVVSPMLESEHIGADGILGLDLLQDLRVLIDFKAQRMQVADAKALGGDRGYEIVVRARRKLGQMIITDARIDGIRTTVLIDTGAQNSIGNRALLEKLRLRGLPTAVSTDVHGTQMESVVTVVERMTIDSMELQSLVVGFADSPAFEALGISERPALILGMANLRMFDRVAIDFASQKVLFDLPDGAAHEAFDRFATPPSSYRS